MSGGFQDARSSHVRRPRRWAVSLSSPSGRRPLKEQVVRRLSFRLSGGLTTTYRLMPVRRRTGGVSTTVKRAVAAKFAEDGAAAKSAKKKSVARAGCLLHPFLLVGRLCETTATHRSVLICRHAGGASKHVENEAAAKPAAKPVEHPKDPPKLVEAKEEVAEPQRGASKHVENEAAAKPAAKPVEHPKDPAKLVEAKEEFAEPQSPSPPYLLLTLPFVLSSLSVH